MSLISAGLKLRLGIDGMLLSVMIRFGHMIREGKKTSSGTSSSGGSGADTDSLSFDWFEDSIDNSVDVFKTAKKTVKNVGQSGYLFMRALGIVVLMVGLSMAGIAMIMSQKGSGRDEGKRGIINGLLGGAVIFGVVGLVGIAVSIGKGL